jgi:pyruvate formate lyase activating enzyme
MNDQAPVFDIQRFSIHDGPGIRTLIFLKGCNFQCSWCQNPESQFNNPVLAFYGSRCHQSFECVNVCQEDAIQKGDFRVDYARCTACGDCAGVCPFEALKMIGEYMTPVQLFERILADHTYYKASLGGVTFTGGEPTLYPRFVDQVVDLCISKGIHTNLETAGSFSFANWRPILEKLNLIYFDLKLIDPDQFATHVGSSYETVMHNARLLTIMEFPVEYRLPLVPGITDTRDNIDGISEFLLSMNVSNIHLVDYHNMGESKIGIINGKQKKLGLDNYTTEARDQVADQLLANGISIIE